MLLLERKRQRIHHPFATGRSCRNLEQGSRDVTERIRSLTRIGIKGSGVVKSMRSSRPNHPACRKTATVCAETQVPDRRIHTALARVQCRRVAMSISSQKMTKKLTYTCAGTSSATTPLTNPRLSSLRCVSSKNAADMRANTRRRSFQAVTPTALLKSIQQISVRLRQKVMNSQVMVPDRANQMHFVVTVWSDSASLFHRARTT